MYDRSNAAHTLSTKHGGRRDQICNNCAYAYLMDTCVAAVHVCCELYPYTRGSQVRMRYALNVSQYTCRPAENR